MGLVKAVREFNPYKDVRITTYAVWWIRSYIQDSILKNHSLVKMGTTQAQKKLFYRLKREQAKLEQRGIVPSEQVPLLAKELNVKESEVKEMSSRMQGELSLNAPMGEEPGLSHIDRIEDPGESADDSLGESEQLDLFKGLLKKFEKTLKDRDQVIFRERLTSPNPITLKEIGERYGVSKERARQLEERVKKQLKEFVANEYPDYKLLTEG